MTDIKDDGPQVNSLDAATIGAVAEQVAIAKANGWTSEDLKGWFGQKGLSHDNYKYAMDGQPVPLDMYHLLAQVSITGLPARAKEPNRAAIKQHIEWLIAPARGDYDDALIEIAFDHAPAPHGSPRMAQLFGLDEIDEAVEFSAAQNTKQRNVYIGAALKLPDTDRNRRCSEDDWYVATAVPIDIDTDYDATRARMAAICDDGLVVVTGMTPDRRSQHWTRLSEPCDHSDEFGHAFAALVAHTGADMKVKDAARIMRLGGTVSWPSEKKLAKGYVAELTTVTEREARSSSLEVLKALEPGAAPAERFDASQRPVSGAGVVRDWTGRVTDGREAHFRNMVVAALADWQKETGCDPTPEELWEEVWPKFSDPARVDNSDGRWTGEAGQKELRSRINNTIRRLRSGALARAGLFSIDTEANREQAESVAANRKAAQKSEPNPRPFDAPTPEGDATDAPKPYKLNLMDWTARRYEAQPVPIEWLCENTIPTATPVLLAAMGGTGKSYMALDLCVEVAAPDGKGKPFFGGQVLRNGTAVFLTAEDNFNSVHRRVYGVDPDGRRNKAPDKLIIAPLPDAGGPIPFVASNGKSLELTEHFFAIRDQLCAIPDLRLVVIDPLQAFVLADVNADPAAGQFMWSALTTICSMTGATVILLHHMRKQGSADIRTTAEAREAIRGSTALVDGARLCYALWKPSEEDARNICSRLDVKHHDDAVVMGAVVKANEKADTGIRTFHRQDHGVLYDVTALANSSASQRTTISMESARAIVAEIGAAFLAASEGRGEGYSDKYNSGKGRYAVDLIQHRSGCDRKLAENLLAKWVMNGVLASEIYDLKTKKRALRQVGNLDQPGG